MYERLEVEREAVIVESSLLTNIDWRLPVRRRYDIGMSDFVEASAFCKEETNPKPKGKENRLSLSLSRKNKSRATSALSPKRPWPTLQPVSASEANCMSRFDFSKCDSYDEMAVKFVPENTF